MADTKPAAPSRSGKPTKGAPAPKGFAAKLNHEVGVGPLKLPLWGWGAVAIGAWWFWFHVIQPYNAAKDAAAAAPTGGSNLGSGSGGGGGGGQTGKATPKHRHGQHTHRHRGGHNQHRHPDKRPAVHGALNPTTFNPRHSGAGVGRNDKQRGNR